MENLDISFEEAWKYHSRKENKDAKGRLPKFEAYKSWKHYSKDRAQKIKDLNVRILSKEKSITALITRMQELEADVKYETSLNETIRSENQRLRDFIKNKLKINE